jgi:hypothetical protein
MDFNALFVQFSTLAGFAGLVAVVINIFKSFGWVQDGQAQSYSAALNLVGMGVLLYLNVFQPQADVKFLDAQAGQIATVLIAVMGYVVQLGGAKLTHIVLKGTPVIGKTNSF